MLTEREASGRRIVTSAMRDGQNQVWVRQDRINVASGESEASQYITLTIDDIKELYKENVNGTV